MNALRGEMRGEEKPVRVYPVVGIGASAGGIGALQHFLPAIPNDRDITFIIVLHLDPKHQSNLAEILQRFCALPVVQAEDGHRIEPNNVYVIPPNATLTIRDGILRLAQLREERGHRAPIDRLFASLAEDQAENAACVVLSGTGSDGTFGLRAIKEHGGLALAQSDAEYDGMVRSATATGLVDVALPAAELPGRIVAHFDHLESIIEKKGLERIHDEAAAHLKRICELLRNRTGHDFSGYKQSAANADIANLLESTQIATVFLDREYNVRSFTPAAKELYSLVESDLGRPISHLRPRFKEDSLQTDAAEVLRKLTPIERRVQSLDGDARYSMRVLPYRTSGDVIGGVVITFIDITQILLAEERIVELSRDLRNRVESLETLLDLVPIGILIAEEQDARIVRVNRYAATLIDGAADPNAKTPLQALDAASRPMKLVRNGEEIAVEDQPLALAARTGEAISGREARILRPDGERVDVLVSASPLFDDAGKVRGAIAGVVDITQRKKDEAHQEMLLHELQHRVKNILATVTALASRLLRTNTTMEAFHDAFLSRLQAMSRTHELLAREKWDGADLRDLGASALEPYATGDNIQLEGPPLFLKPNTAATLGMVFHELASNAAKYGALTAEGGRVSVTWSLKPGSGDHEEIVEIIWRERGGKSVSPDVEKGFGTTFIARSLKYELDGTAELDFAPEGLQCTMRFPTDKGVKGSEIHKKSF